MTSEQRSKSISVNVTFVKLEATQKSHNIIGK
jgi:hypothetical protein